jgi:Tfp pilus assembly protein FimT
MRRRSGSTLVEQTVLITVVGLCLAVAAHTGQRAIQSASVHNASRALVELLMLARERAMATGARTALHLDSRLARVVVHTGLDTLARLDLATTHHVQLNTTRDSLAFAPSGLGYGAANLRIIVSRGAVRDTITVSRLGRVKR